MLIGRRQLQYPMPWTSNTVVPRERLVHEMLDESPGPTQSNLASPDNRIQGDTVQRIQIPQHDGDIKQNEKHRHCLTVVVDVLLDPLFVLFLAFFDALHSSFGPTFQ